MAKRRLIGKPGSKYHVISRFVERQFATGSAEQKRMFLQLMQRQAAFSGVEVLTYCIMGNHFHILLHVPERPLNISEKEILRRLGKIWKPERVKELKATFKTWRKISVIGDELVEEKLARFRERMYNLPEFMKDLKQRYSKWFNFVNERKGTLFEERYKSVLVEDGTALRMMAAYIELNPVRAGIVEDPTDFQYSGYAQAVANNVDRQRGIRTIMTDPRDPKNYGPKGKLRILPWKTIEPRYRYWLFERGRESHHRDGRQKKRGFTSDQYHAARRAAKQDEGEIPHVSKLVVPTSAPLSPLEKSRTMTEALVLGGRKFVEGTIQELSEKIGMKYAKAHTIQPHSESTSTSNSDSNDVADNDLCQLANPIDRSPPDPNSQSTPST